MLRSHGLCRLNISPTNECDELSLPKGVLLRLGGGMGCRLCIAQVGIWKEFWYIFIKLIN